MKKGVLYAVAAYLLWGLLPLYWKLFQTMPAWEILAHRILWSFVFVGALLTINKRWSQLKQAVSERKQKLAILCCSLLISSNWLIFIWAVNAGHVIETSLGYYINPLLNVLFGVFLLKEKLQIGKWISIGFAAIGVAIITFQYGQVPWIAISLALSFSLYGLAKKMIKIDSMLGLAWETILVSPLALLYLMFVQVKGEATAFTLPWYSILLLLLSGAATALPLYWFAQATKILPFTTVGFIQYLAPSTSLLLAIFIFHEKFTTPDLIAFGFIWCSLFVFTFSSMRQKQVVTAKAA
ncbi:EamA family transporter RarD [Brevibacillus ginsengisoli]|uniref:EamA family transporter RarD n=1 Tax=Brevibacillus ginsengisoli TaxID=363854 RepID=UPI003CF304A8